MAVPDNDEDISRSSSLMASLISALNSADEGVPPVPLDPEADTTVLAELGADDRILVEDEPLLEQHLSRIRRENFYWLARETSTGWQEKLLMAG